MALQSRRPPRVTRRVCTQARLVTHSGSAKHRRRRMSRSPAAAPVWVTRDEVPRGLWSRHACHPIPASPRLMCFWVKTPRLTHIVGSLTSTSAHTRTKLLGHTCSLPALRDTLSCSMTLGGRFKRRNHHPKPRKCENRSTEQTVMREARRSVTVSHLRWERDTGPLRTLLRSARVLK